MAVAKSVPQTITLGAQFHRDPHGISGNWVLPKPIRYDRHWASAGMRAQAEKKGLNILTASTPFTVAIPIYRGVPSPVYKAMKSRARRVNMGRWAN